MKLKFLIPSILLILVLCSCSSIKQIGDLGPKKLPVYEISHNDFLSASRIMVILDEKGNIAAHTGGTVSGPGAVALETAGTVVTAGAIAYGARAIQQGLEHTTVHGIPSRVSVSGHMDHSMDLDNLFK